MKQELQVLLSHESTEWYTPAEYVELARAVMGGIDLDPASSPIANETVKASRIHTQSDNGLLYSWHGRVFLNPPYSKTDGRSNQEIFAAKLIAEYQAGRVHEAILLTKAALGYTWFDNLLRCWPVCLMYGLIRFQRPDGSGAGKAKLGSAFFYFGPSYDRFSQVFSKIGRVISPIEQARSWQMEL
jgi:hypothetical protein